MEAVQKIWPSLFGSLRQLLGPRRWALFREAAPGDIEEDGVWFSTCPRIFTSRACGPIPW
jgi:hypothetical protein